MDTVSSQVVAYSEVQRKAHKWLNLEWLHFESLCLEKHSQISVVAVAAEAAANRKVNSRFETLVAQEMLEILVVSCASCLLETQQDQSSVVQAEFWAPVVAELHSEPTKLHSSTHSW